jgi:spermidine/putrescine transport system permease protein
MFKKSWVFQLWLFVFIVVPILLMLLSVVTTYSVFNPRRFDLNFRAVTVLVNPVFLRALYQSLRFAVIVTVISLIIGYPVAYLLARSTSPYKRIWVIALIIPVWSNMLLRIIAFEKLFYPESILNMFGISLNLIGTDIAIVIGMISIYLPFMIFPIYAVLEKLDSAVLEAAYDLYASPLKRFIHVVLPLSYGGIISGILMTALPAMTTFALPERLSGGQLILIGNLIQNYVMRTAQIDFASAIAILLLLVMVLFYRILLKFDAEGETLV